MMRFKVFDDKNRRNRCIHEAQVECSVPGLGGVREELPGAAGLMRDLLTRWNHTGLGVSKYCVTPFALKCFQYTHPVMYVRLAGLMSNPARDQITNVKDKTS
jgi:hypothetical protein